MGVFFAMAVIASPAFASPTARIAEISYRALDAPDPAPGNYRNPVLPGFHPDPSVVKVGQDFYLVTSTFGWFPGLPVFHSTDLVNWQLIGNAIDRPGMVDFTGMRVVQDALYAPAITWHDGTFYIFNTCVRCGGNFYLTARDPAGPWSDPKWLAFDGIDPSLFVDEDGRGWITYNDLPEGGPQYEGHRAIWVQEFDLASGSFVGTRTQLVDGGVHPEDQPIWAEGPHIYKVGGWYYLMPAEGGTADQHSQTIYRSRAPDGPYEAGPFNPILTQRDLPPDRPDRVEATGHADLVQLDDGSWWGVFLATRPFAGQDTLLGRETWLLPVRWVDGWPRFLDPGEAVAMELPAPDLPSDYQADWSHWTERFDGKDISGEWLRIRNQPLVQQYALDRDRGGLLLAAGPDAAGSMGQPSFLGRRLRHHSAEVTMRLAFAPAGEGDFAGLMAFMGEPRWIAVGIEQAADGSRQVSVRQRSDDAQEGNGQVLASAQLAATGEIELRMAIDKGEADFAWRPAGRGAWRALADDVDVSYMASIRSGLFTGVTVGPYAYSPAGD
ncbi:MAG TPA: glycoside hydrolase family 43 protein [Sphingomonadaceae bacterium]|nr:glycoside hydrolase family 43 protein [Sphingomonadaceae bacterium]